MKVCEELLLILSKKLYFFSRHKNKLHSKNLPLNCKFWNSISSQHYIKTNYTKKKVCETEARGPTSKFPLYVVTSLEDVT